MCLKPSLRLLKNIYSVRRIRFYFKHRITVTILILKNTYTIFILTKFPFKYYI